MPPNGLAGLANLISGIREFNDPDKEKRDAILQRAATDSDFAQRLKENPSLVDELIGRSPRLWGKDRGATAKKVIAGTPDDPIYKEKRAKASVGYNEANAMRGLQETDSGAMQTQLDEFTKMGIPVSPVDPLTEEQRKTYQEYAAEIRPGGKGPIQQAAMEANTKAQNLSIEATNKKKAEVLRAQARVAELGYTPAQLFELTNPYMDSKDRKLKDKPLLSQADYQTITKDPDIVKGIDEAADYYYKMKGENEHADLKKATIEARAQSLQYNWAANKANKITSSTGGMYNPTPEDVQEWMDKREQLAPYFNKKEADVPDELKTTWAVAQGLKEEFSQESIRKVQKAYTDIAKNPLYKKVFAPAKGIRPTAADVESLNQVYFDVLSKVPGAKISQVRMKDEHWYTPNKPFLTNVDSRGVDVVDPNAIDEGADPKATSLVRDPDQLQKAKGVYGAVYKNDDGKFLADLKKQFPNASVAQLTATLNAVKEK